MNVYTCKLVEPYPNDYRGHEKRSQHVLAWAEYEAPDAGQAVAMFKRQLARNHGGRIVVSRGHTNNRAKHSHIGKE